MQSYGNMAREHFYLNDINKAYYYHDRMIRGKAENSKSALKRMSYFVVKNKRDGINDDTSKKLKTQDVVDEHALPSPREANKM